MKSSPSHLLWIFSSLVLCFAASCRTVEQPAPATAPPAATSHTTEAFRLRDISNLSDDEFIDMVQRDSTLLYVDKAHPVSGLIAEDGYIAHVGSNGFGLMALCIAAERNWIPREDAAQRVARILHTFLNTGSNHLGALWWITDAPTATKNPYGGGFDIVETAYVSAGALVCREYFDRDSTTERSVRDMANALYGRVQFDEFLARDPETGLEGLLWAYDPAKQQFGDLPIVGYHEAMVVYLMALGSPSHPVPASAWSVWTNGYTWVERYGYEYYFCPALFTHQYSLVWMDTRELQDDATRSRGITYFENSRRAALSHKAYAEENPLGHPGYGPIWGLTDCGCPLHPNHFGGHGLSWPWDIEGDLDDGTVAVSAAGASIMFTPEESIAFLRHIYMVYGEKLYDRWGFRNAFNVKTGWVDRHHDALNQGAMVCAIENHRSGLIWKLFMRCPEVQEALRKAGFTKRDS